MCQILQKTTVLVLNRNWQAIHARAPADAFCMMAAGSAKGLDVRDDGSVIPVTWEDWLQLPVREHDQSARSPRGPIRIPTVLVAVNYGKVPLFYPRLGANGIWERDGGVCQYTGKRLSPHEGNIDHVVPRAQGGQTSWENCVLSHRDVNVRKGARTPNEAGLRLLREPVSPRPLPATQRIRNVHDIPDWKMFLGA